MILEEYYGARQIVISTGEIQSTSDPDMQNSIYAVGSFLTQRKPQDTKPIICVNLFKDKWASLARGVASIGLSGLEPPLCLLTEWAGLGYPILSAVRLPT